MPRDDLIQALLDDPSMSLDDLLDGSTPVDIPDTLPADFSGFDEEEIPDTLPANFFDEEDVEDIPDTLPANFFDEEEPREKIELPGAARRRRREEFRDPNGPLTLGDFINVAREFGSGGTFADELEATVRSGIDRFVRTEADTIAEQFGGQKRFRSASEIHSEIERDRDKFRAEHAGAVLALNLTGALFTGSPLSAYVGLGASVGRTALLQGVTGLAEGAAFGAASGETLEERGELAALGGLFGASLGAVAGALGSAVSPTLQAQRLKNAVPELTDDVIHSEVAAIVLENQTRLRIEGALPSEVPPVRWYTMKYAADNRIPVERVDAAVEKFGGIDDWADLEPEELQKLWQQSIVGKDKPSGAYKDVPINKPTDHLKQLKVSWVKTFDQHFAPIKRLLIHTVGPKFAAQVNRALNRGMVETAHYGEIVRSVQAIQKEMDSGSYVGKRIKAQMLDFALDGEYRHYQGIKNLVLKEFGEEQMKALDVWFEYNLNWAARHNRALNPTNPLTKGWVHTQKKGKVKEGLLAPTSPAVSNRGQDVSALNRTRTKISKEKNWEELVDEYENPINTMQNWVNDNAPQLELSEALMLRPLGGKQYVDSDLPDYVIAKMSEQQRKAYEATGEISETWLEKLTAAERNMVGQAMTGGPLNPMLREMFNTVGMSKAQANDALEVLQSVLYNSQKAPAKLVRNIRNLGYSTTIMTPYGAAMNLHDIFISAGSDGIMNAVRGGLARGLEKGLNVSTKDIGIVDQVAGEYIKKISQEGPEFWNKFTRLTEDVVKFSSIGSGFKAADQLGKNQIMRTALQAAKSQIIKGNFRQRWGNTFTQRELAQIERDLADGVASPLVRELAAFRLSEMQPINPMAMTKSALDHPNARMFYMLKNFAIRQLDHLRTNSFDYIARGIANRDLSQIRQGVQFFTMYTLLAGSGYWGIQEGRQPLKGGNIGDAFPDAGAEAMLLNTGNVMTFGALGASDQQFQKFLDNPVEAMLDNLWPPFIAVEAPSKDLMNMIQDGEYVPKNTLKALPIVGKTFFNPLFEE